MGDTEKLIAGARQCGDPTVDALFDAFYTEIRLLAGAIVRSAGRDQPLQTTELVHEAFLRLHDLRGHPWQDRRHFLNAVAQSVHRALLDEIRAKRAAKRGGDLQRTTLSSNSPAAPLSIEKYLALDLALARLRKGRNTWRRAAEVFDLSFCCDLSHGEIAQSLGVSERQVARDHALARAWLRREMGY